jgi:hypothetical protein
MSWDARRSLDAMRLLRALVDQAKAASRREDDDEVVGHTVIPTTAVAMAAGMDLGTPRYHAASDQLLELLALERDEDADYAIISVVGDPEAFKITSWAPELLRQAGF